MNLVRSSPFREIVDPPFDKRVLQWVLDVYHGLRVCVSMPEPGETWEERILDEGAYCDASQVHVPRL